MKCLEKDPDRRYASAGDLAEDLDRFLSGRAIQARPPSFVEKLGRRVRRNRALAISLAALLVLSVGAAVVVGVLVSGMSGVREEKEKAEEEKRRAEEKRDLAQSEVRDKETKLEKVRRSSRVLNAAYAKLGPVQRELKQAGLRIVRGRNERRAILEKYETDLEDFRSAVPKDSASQATRFAVEGWLTILAGLEKEGKAHFETSRKTDPEVPWGYVFEGMAFLADYLNGKGLPGVVLGEEAVEVGEAVPESERLHSLRTRYEELMEAARRSGALDEASALGLAGVLAAAAGSEVRDLAAAEAALSEALAMPELAWVEEEIRHARARVRFERKRFAEARADVEHILRRGFEGGRLYLNLGIFLHGLGLEAQAGGQNPCDLFRRSVEAYGKAAAWRGTRAEALAYRGAVEMHWANASSARGKDPGPLFEKALRNIEEARRADPTSLPALNNLGSVYFFLGSWRGRQGGDPRPHFRKAVTALDASIARLKRSVEQRVNRGAAFSEWGHAEERFGGDPMPFYRKAEAAFDDVLADAPKHRYAHINRCNTIFRMGQWALKRGGDPLPHFRKALAGIEKALEIHPGSPRALMVHGTIHFQSSEVVRTTGGNPLPHLDKALASYDRALDRDPNAESGRLNRGQIHLRKAQFLRDRGLDSRPLFERAIEDFEGAVRSMSGAAQPHMYLGFTRVQRAKAGAVRGEDPRPRLEEALRAFDEGRKVDGLLVPLALHKSDVLEILGRYDESLEMLEDLQRKLRRRDSALEEEMDWVRKEAGAPPWRRHLYHAQVYLDIGFYVGAKPLFEAAVRGALEAGIARPGGENRLLADAHYNLACIHSLLSVGKIASRAEARPVKKEIANAERGLALDHFRKALEFGYANFPHLKKDPDLDPLRDLPEFKALVKKWETKRGG